MSLFISSRLFVTMQRQTIFCFIKQRLNFSLKLKRL